jgi:hypothetical protein
MAPGLCALQPLFVSCSKNSVRTDEVACRRRPTRYVLFSLLIALAHTGCEGGADSKPVAIGVDPQIHKRQKEMKNFMEKEGKKLKADNGKH